MDQTVENSVICPLLIGRARQITALREYLNLAASGKGQFVLLAGEAGMGKSRLVRETVEEARQTGFEILAGHCYETERSFPYAPIIEALDDFLMSPDLKRQPEEIVQAARQFTHHILETSSSSAGPAGPSDPEQVKRRLFYDLAQLIGRLSGQRPLLFVIEDLHWSDESTLEFLLHQLQHTGSLRCAVLLAYRPEELTPGLAHFLAEIDRRRATHEMKLAALDLNEVSALLQAIFNNDHPIHVNFLQKIFDLTEGNPFFIEETMKALIASGDIFFDGSSWNRKPLDELHIPRSVQDAVQQRFERLSPPARQMVAICSVAGQRFDFELLRQVTQSADLTLIQWMKEAIQAQLIVDLGEGTFAFRHALTCKAIYRGLLSIERQQLHQAITASLEERARRGGEGGLPGALAADLAYHSFKAGEWQKAIDYAEQAGRMALHLMAPREAARFYTLAIHATANLQTMPAVDWLRARGHCYEILGDFASADADYEAAHALAVQSGDRHGEWQSLIELGLLWASNDYAHAGEYLIRAFDLARQIGDPLLLARSLARLGNWRLNTGDILGGTQASLEALRIFQEHGDTGGEAETHDLLSLAYSLGGDMRRAVDHMHQGAVLFRRTGDRRGLLSCLNSFNIDLFHSYTVYTPPRSFDECQANALESLEIATQIDWTAGQALAEWTAGGMYAMFGELGQALNQTRKALDTAMRIDHRQWMAAAYATLGMLETILRQSRQAIATLEKGLVLARELGSEYWTGELVSRLALAYCSAGESQSAENVLQSSGLLASNWEMQKINTLGERDVLWAYGETCLLQGRPGEALSAANKLLACAYGSFDLPVETAVTDPPVPALLKLKGEALIALSRLEEAEQILRQALSAAIERPDRTLGWKIHAALGHLYALQQQRELATAQYAQASEEISKLAGTIGQQDLRDSFAQFALSTIPEEAWSAKKLAARRKDTTAAGGLTRREAQIAALVAQGKSNREIAGTLVLSERTVENHVARIMDRLNVSARAQIAAWAVKAGLQEGES